ncbi:uncharacterized protein [Primulina eburnea]|uniref:uncharacterized protein n=1 Tax=Primulina eburnea TaxID=1245227 RepID=UPI003C6C5F6A
MANYHVVNVSQPAIPVSKGECYDFRSIKIKTLFKSQDLWDLVENGYSGEDEEEKVKENKKRDAKALFFIQQTIHESIFTKISAANTAKEAWTTLQRSFQGSSKVITIKLQSLRRYFETLQMKNGESVQHYFTRVDVVVNQMRSYGEEIKDQIVVAKVLRSWNSKFDYKVAVIEESTDLTTYSFDELMGSLQSHEVRLKKYEPDEEKAFHVKGEMSGRGRENNKKKEENEAKLLMAYHDYAKIMSDIWCLDSGCSNHMTNEKSLRKELDDSYKLKVRIGDNKQMQVEGKGIVAIKNDHSSVNPVFLLRLKGGVVKI